MGFRSTITLFLVLNFLVLSRARVQKFGVYKAVSSPPEEDNESRGDEVADTENRIINGFTPGRLDNPFVVRLLVEFSDGTALCTGAILSGSWVVTAGHCGKDALSITIQLGLFTRNEGALQTITIGPSNIIVHQNFVATNVQVINDIALLRLPFPGANIFTPTRRIRAIPFACSNDGTFENRISRSCGWGITTDDAVTSSETLQCVDMPVISNSECARSWPTLLLPSHICTSTINNRTTCSGDSGGPLFLGDILNRPQLIGLTSFGSDPCAQTQPSVYTRITSYSSWITQRTLLLCDIL